MNHGFQHLLPEIIQKTGHMTIDHLIVFKLNSRILDALQFLVSQNNGENIYLPGGRKIPHRLALIRKIKKTVIANNGKIIPISYRKTLFIDQSSTLFIEPDAEKIYVTMMLLSIIEG